MLGSSSGARTKQPCIYVLQVVAVDMILHVVVPRALGLVITVLDRRISTASMCRDAAGKMARRLEIGPPHGVRTQVVATLPPWFDLRSAVPSLFIGPHAFLLLSATLA
jgi:hypothetical protein